MTCRLLALSAATRAFAATVWLFFFFFFISARSRNVPYGSSRLNHRSVYFALARAATGVEGVVSGRWKAMKRWNNEPTDVPIPLSFSFVSYSFFAFSRKLRERGRNGVWTKGA